MRLLISSPEKRSGKTGIAVALGLIIRDKGFEVGYFKALSTNPVKIGNEFVDNDCFLAKEFLGSGETAIVLDRPYIDFIALEDPIKLRKKILDSFFEVSKGKDVMLIEGGLDYTTASAIEICDLEIAKMLDANVLMVAKYSDDFVVDKLIAAKREFGEKLKKVILNMVTGYKKSYLEAITSKILKRNGLELIGFLPHDASLVGISASEIAEAIKGRFAVKAKDVVLEQILIGAMKAESALSHLRAAHNYALVVGGDRSDIMLLALESGVKCIIATGNLEPSTTVLSKAEELGVPIIISDKDSATTIAKINEKFGKIGVRKENIVKIRKMLEENVRIEELLKHLGL